MSWFRLHTTMIHHAVVWNLSATTFKIWVGLLCLAKEGDGIIPNIQEIAFQLRCSEPMVKRVTDELSDEYGLLERLENGTFRPHNWDRHQYRSDVSTARVKRFRKRFQTVTETAPEYRVQSTDTETEQKQRAAAKNHEPKQGGFPDGLTADELESCWHRHKRFDPREPMDLVFRRLMTFPAFSLTRLRRVHPAWCAYWQQTGWNAFGSLTFLAWVEAGMPEPPEVVERTKTPAQIRQEAMKTGWEDIE